MHHFERRREHHEIHDFWNNSHNVTFETGLVCPYSAENSASKLYLSNVVVPRESMRIFASLEGNYPYNSRIVSRGKYSGKHWETSS